MWTIPFLTVIHIAAGTAALLAGRMGIAFFIAAGALFLGQPDVFPEPLKPVALRAVPVVLVVALTLFWLIRVLFVHRRLKVGAQNEQGIRQGIGWRGRAGVAGTPGQPAP